MTITIVNGIVAVDSSGGGGGATLPINLATQVTGNLDVSHLNGGIAASAGSFWAGDGTWRVPPGGGSGTVTSGGVGQATWYGAGGTTVGANENITFTSAGGANFAAAVTAASLAIKNFTSAGVVHNTAGGILFTTKVALDSEVSGNLPVTNLAAGVAASATSFWAGDGSWRVPAGGSGSGTVTSGGVGQATWYGAGGTTVGGNENVVFTSAGGGDFGGIVDASAGFNINGVNALSFFGNDNNPGASIAIGASALSGQTSTSAGYNNIAIGFRAMGGGSITTAGINNIAIGASAGWSQTSGSSSICIGFQANKSQNLIGIVAIGANTIPSTNNAVTIGVSAGGAGVSVGNNALVNGTGSGCTTIGTQAAQFISSGTNNTAVGTGSLLGVTGSRLTGSSNTAVGFLAGQALQGAAAKNVFIGASAGQLVFNASGNVVLGTGVASVTLVSGNNNIYIGCSNAIDATLAATNNELKIGNSATPVIYASAINTTTPTVQIAGSAMRVDSDLTITMSSLQGTGSRAVLADANGLLSAPVSDLTVKENIKAIPYGMLEVQAMSPVSFEYIKEFKNYGEGRQIGLIAQEIEKIIPEVIGLTRKTGKKSLDYAGLVPVLIRAVQELNSRVETLEGKIS